MESEASATPTKGAQHQNNHVIRPVNIKKPVEQTQPKCCSYIKLEVSKLPTHVEELVVRISFRKIDETLERAMAQLRKMGRENEKADSNLGETWNNYLVFLTWGEWSCHAQF